MYIYNIPESFDAHILYQFFLLEITFESSQNVHTFKSESFNQNPVLKTVIKDIWYTIQIRLRIGMANLINIH